MVKKREFGPDLVRAVACIFVLAVHFYMYTGFYKLPYSGWAMAISVPLRMALMTCVPMFIILTGYLCLKKSWSGGYYRSLIPILLSYVICGLAIILFRYVKYGIALGPLGIVRSLLDYSAVPYGWYVEMYIGLFLVIPFLNAAWRGLDKKGRLALLISVFAITCAPSVVNYKRQILPDFWVGAYPVAYYFLGAWLREYPVKIKRVWLFLGWIAMTGLCCLVQYDLFAESAFVYSTTNYWSSIFVFGESFFLFAFLVSFSGEKLPRPVKWCVRRVALLSFPLYMLSYVGDALIYTKLKATCPDFESFLPYHVPIVAVNLLLSAVLAQLVDWLTKAIVKLIPEHLGKKKNVNTSEG